MMSMRMIEWLDGLAYPSGVFLMALLALFAARRLRSLGELRVGMVGLLLMTAFVAVSAQNPELRQWLFAPSRLPVTLGLLSTPWVAWFTTRREGSGSHWLPRIQTVESPSDDGGEVWVVVAVLGGVMALAWWLEPPLGPPAVGGPVATGGPPPSSHLPWFLSGWQEMRLVMRPLWHWLLWPLWIVALLAVPYLEPDGQNEDEETSRREATRLFLFFAAALGWVPVTVGSLLRDGQWQLSGPLGPRHDVAVAQSLGEWFWSRGLGVPPPMNGLWRELPGCLAVASYIVLLCLLLPRWRASHGLFRRYRKQLGEVRYRLALALLTALGWLPLKLLVYWFLAIDDWIVLPFWPGGI